LWQKSDERAEARRLNVRLVWIGAPAVIALCTLAILNVNTSVGSDSYGRFSRTSTLLLILAASVAYAFTLIGTFTLMRARRAFRMHLELGMARELEKEESEIAADGADLKLATLWAANQKRIDYYHRIATAQAESGFRNGTVASFSGFVIVIAAAVVAAFAGNQTASIAAGAVGIAGGALSAYIGATFIKLQSESATQLRRFFLQPVEFSRMLGAERLIETLPGEQRVTAVQHIVGQIINPASDQDGQQ
jgi:hypothetical protein